MGFSALLDKMFIFVVLMVIGYVCARKGILSPSFTKGASALTVNFFMSATILNSVLTVETAMSWAELGRILLVMCVMQVLGYAVAALVMKLIPLDKELRPGYELLMSMGNSMFIALPVVDGLFGPLAVFYVSLSCIPFNVLLYTYGVWRLKSGKSKDGLRLKDILSVPLIATLVSLAVFLIRPPVPGAIRGLASAMAGATMPLSMLVIGSSLGSVSLLDAFRNGKLYLASLVRLLVIPLLTWLVCSLLTEDPVLLMTAVIIGASPSAVMVTVLSVQYGRDPVYTAQGTLQNTVLSMVTIPLLVYLLGV